MSGKPSTKGAKGGAGAGAAAKAAAKAPTSSSAPTAAEKDVELASYSTSSKPDRDVYNQEQEAIKAQIAGKQAQLVGLLDCWIAAARTEHQKMMANASRHQRAV